MSFSPFLASFYQLVEEPTPKVSWESALKLLSFSVDCSIDDFTEVNVNTTTLNTSIDGFFAYRVSCDGMITSIRADGFCYRSDESTGASVVLLVFVTQEGEDPLTSADTIEFIDAECDTSPIPGFDNYYRGHIDANISESEFRVSSGDLLGLKYGLLCSSDSCLFLPALVNERSSHGLMFYDKLILRDIGQVSLQFSATIISGKLIYTMCIKNKFSIC